MPRKLRLPRLIDRSRLLVGFLLAAFVPGLLYGTLAAISVMQIEGILPGLMTVGKFALLLLYFSVPAVAFFGLPFFWIYRRLAWENLPSYVVAGAASGVLWMLILAWIQLGHFPRLDLQDIRLVMIKIAVPGAIAGFVFYMTVYVKYHHLKWSVNTLDKRWLWLLLVPMLLVQERLLDWANNKIDENTSLVYQAMDSAWSWLSHDIF